MITEQSLESLSATFIAKFHVSSALSAGRSTARRESFFNEILVPHQDVPKVVSQYQTSALSLKSDVVKDGFPDLPVKQSTPVFLCDRRTTSGSLSNMTSCLQIENSVKRQLFNDTGEDLINDSKSFRLSPPCHCLDAEVVDQLTCLQQDLGSRINILESSLSQGSSSLDVTSEVISSHSDIIISPPIEFSEQYNCSFSQPVNSIETLSTIYTQGSNSNTIISQCFSGNKATMLHSYALFNRLISIVKLMQHYPLSVAFVAWHRFVQRRKSLAVLRTTVHHKINRNVLMNSFTAWKLCTHKVLEYKQLEILFLENSQKGILSATLQKWIATYHKWLKDNNILDNLLISRNHDTVKNSFFKWKRNFEISIKIRNHMVIMVIIHIHNYMYINDTGKCVDAEVLTLMEELLYIKNDVKC